MKKSWISLAFTVLLTLALPVFAQDKAAPVRMGSGYMTFDTVPGWGLGDDGKSVLGSTHGGVTIDKKGNIYTTSSLGIFVFSPEGKVIRRFLGDKYNNIHDIEIRDEGDAEFLYGARNAAGEGVKIHAETGDVVLKLGLSSIPESSGLKLTRWSPTAITVAKNGDIFLSDGYASNHVFKYDKTGKYIKHFGEKGNELKQFNTAHGMTLDTRYEPNRLLVCDRNHTPNGRLLHYDLDGNYMSEVITGLFMPTSAAVQGDYVSVPDLQGRVWVLDKENKIAAVLGTDAEKSKRGNFQVPQDKWIEGIFSGTHGSYWDKDFNLYVQDWNVSGRIMKLVRVK